MFGEVNFLGKIITRENHVTRYLDLTMFIYSSLAPWYLVLDSMAEYWQAISCSIGRIGSRKRHIDDGHAESMISARRSGFL